MERIILWSIGIIIYLLIGFGFKSSVKKIQERLEEPLSRIESFFAILLWPIEFGCLISEASSYYQTESNALYGIFPGRPFKHVLMEYIIEQNIKLAAIEKALHNIESKEQKG